VISYAFQNLINGRVERLKLEKESISFVACEYKLSDSNPGSKKPIILFFIPSYTWFINKIFYIWFVH